MKNIIVYLSPLEKGFDIVNYSVQVAERLGLNIHYVYNVDPEVVESLREDNNISKEELEQKIIEEKKIEIGKLVESQNWNEKDITAVYSVYSGAFDKMFKTIASRNHCELVLFPVSEAGKQLHIKSIFQILDIMKLPVWCFPVGTEFRQIKTIVYASDYKKQDIDTIKALSAFATHFKAKINILHVFKGEKFKQQLIDSGLKELIGKKIAYQNIEVHSKKKNSITKGITDFSKAAFADLLVLLKRDKNIFRNLFAKGTIVKMLKKNELPILIYKK
ncbi:hypothetical protein GM418_01125 [Maribellus comscasis]|uniref:Universal stress protein n=1 Tax=Maribellus comscasis TaxID=2681766 RepID=A0A6I6JHN9_9BACT|nr:hypothetical protein [Maribellus comscasis]QGY42306.1 hypothetical protein GM418_01125 [Maribellus comscasis]